MVAYGALFILWICFYKKYFIWKAKKGIKKRLKEGNNNGLLGRRTFEICDDKIIETTEYGKGSTNIKSIEDIFINDEYAFIYINRMQAYIIPLRAFYNRQEKYKFI
ncbi:YcxB family protein [Clostridium chromiireducens]|uniref:YcxB family protein n=1 Tax=Clostridium chromiireducens TaxID=225345 RepID=UPI003AF569AF